MTCAFPLLHFHSFSLLRVTSFFVLQTVSHTLIASLSLSLGTLHRKVFPCFTMCASGLYTMWAQAHAELMNATGWDALANRFMETVKSTPNVFTSALADVTELVQTIKWSDPFFRYLAIAHGVLLIAVLWLSWGRVSDTRLEVMACGLLILAQATFLLNSPGRRHASVLFTEPRLIYFDENGAFITIFFWLPIMCHAVVLLFRVFARFILLVCEVGRKRAKQAGGQRQVPRDANSELLPATDTRREKKDQ